VNCALRARDGAGPAETLAELEAGLASARPTLVTATDGNHGRAVAWMARLLGLPARIFVPAVISATAVRAIAAEGAEVVQTDLVYDDVVAVAAASCVDLVDQVLVQDTAWPGYTEVPQRIVDGYATLFAELDEQLGATAADLVVVPTGVGSLLQAALEHYRAPTLLHRPAVLAAEPVTAACVTRSLAAGSPVSVDTSAFTILAGLNCGTVSHNAWPAINGGLDAGIGVTDAEAMASVHRLSRHGVAAGPCGAAALAGARAVLSDPLKRDQLGLGPESIVVLISTEGTAANPPNGAS
jgi:diaminopropionate ammonia-lyase